MIRGQRGAAAAQTTIEALEGETAPPRLFESGRRLMHGLRAASVRPGRPMLVQGPGPMFHAGFTPLAQVRDFRETLSYDKPRYAAFVAAMQERGIRLIGRGLWYISAAHTREEIDRCIETAYEVLSTSGFP